MDDVDKDTDFARVYVRGAAQNLPEIRTKDISRWQPSYTIHPTNYMYVSVHVSHFCPAQIKLLYRYVTKEKEKEKSKYNKQTVIYERHLNECINQRTG